jgi:hypothetical protein
MMGFADSSRAPRSIEAVARRAQIWSDSFFRKSEISGNLYSWSDRTALLLNRQRPQKLSLVSRARITGVTPKPPAGVGLNPLKDFDLTEGQTFGIPSARLGFPSARFGIPSAQLGFPSAQLGIPSVLLGNGFLVNWAAIASDRLRSRKEEAG